MKAGTIDRIVALGLAILFIAVLSIAAWLNPNSQGHGTHRQLGLSPCMWVVTLDKPCPTCGMTTSFSHAGEGSWIQSFKTQPMGTILVILTCAITIGALVQSIFGSRVYSTIEPILKPKLFVLMGALLIAAWIYKIITWT